MARHERQEKLSDIDYRPVFETATLSPESVLAGDSVEVTVRLVIGDGYTDGPSRLVFDIPGTLGMSRPTRMHQESHGYVTATVTNPHVRYAVNVWDMEIGDFTSREKQSWRGMAARIAVLDLAPGLQAGDVIEVRWGATSGGYGPGTKVTTVVPEPDYRATLHVRYFASTNPGRDRQIPSDAKPSTSPMPERDRQISPDAAPPSNTNPIGVDRGIPDYGRSFEGYDRPTPEHEVALSLRVLPRAPHHLRLIRQVDRALLLAHDAFWNVADVADPATIVDGPTPDRRNEHGVFVYDAPNIHLTSRGLPMTETPAMDGVYEGYNLYWGDVHTHSAFSIDCVEREKMTMTPGDLMRAARLRSGLDFYATTDHHQPWDVPRHRLGREAWEATLEAVRAHHEPGAFVVFPGIEFRCPRGDTVVLFNWMPGYDEIDRRDWTDVRKLWAALEGRDYLTIPHFHNGGKLNDGVWWTPGGAVPGATPSSGRAPTVPVEPVLEIFSCHGSYEREDALEHHIPLIKQSRPDRYGAYFLKQGYRYGFVANSDGHKGHVGTNGVTAVFAETLTRDAILDAYRQRHVYGTTNARIRLLFTAQTGAGGAGMMGDVLPNGPAKTFRIDVTGESPLKKIDLFRNGDLYRRFVPDGTTRRFRTNLTIEDAAPSDWYVRATQCDNHIAYSSPIWFTTVKS
jgi:hypothetical protein